MAGISSLLVIVFVMMSTLPLTVSAQKQIVTDVSKKSDDTDTESYTKTAYSKYLSEHKDATMAEQNIVLNSSMITDSKDTEILTDFMGKAGECVKSNETGYVEYTFQVEQEGFYNVQTEYYPIIGKGSTIIRSLKIDNAIPFEEAREIYFKRIWKNGESIQKDAAGNEIRPTQIETPDWLTVNIADATGYYIDPFKFFLTKGNHTLRFESVKEPIVLGAVTLCKAKEVPTYSERLQEYRELGYQNSSNAVYKIQGEQAALKSDSMLYPNTDRASAGTEFSDPSKTKLNTIGGEKWQLSGQWIVWNVHAEKAGLYKIGLKARQNIINGAYSSRTLYVNGEIPCKEAEAIRFPYNSSWQMYELKAGDQDLLVYLHEGDNDIKLQATIGDQAPLQQKVNVCLKELNDVYRKIFMITGPLPDVYRDYQFHKQIPDVLEKLARLGQELEGYYQEYKKISGQNGEQAQILSKLSRQIGEIIKNPDSIASRFVQFKNNIVSLGTWLNVAKQQPLEIDYLIIASPEKEMPSIKVGFLKQLKFTLQAFLSSFTQDYSMVSGTSAQDKSDIKVWLGNSLSGGRDQAQVLKKMIDNQFTKTKGINIELQLVAMSSLLTATLAQKGPDVALTLAGSEPVNYAVRNAAIDLSQFSDCDEVLQRFMPSSLTQLSFNKGVYGLPESQTFYMMFYRKDILHDLGLEVPQTWEDVIKILPVLQKKQLNFGMPQVIGDTVGVGFNAYAMLLFQHGGSLYENDGIASTLNKKEAVDAFLQWTKFYTDYALDRQYDFINRFRTGEIPIGIADYTTYNTLSVFAPEIKGLWEFTEVPGVLQPDGTINRSVAGNVTACAIMSNSTNYKDSWEFLKWWTSSETQTEFGLELESIMGPSARYSPANKEALYQIPWSKKEFDTIQKQWQSVVGIPEVPGGYFTSRYVDFAFRKAVNAGDDPGESIEDAAKSINTEIESKRKEFKLTTK